MKCSGLETADVSGLPSDWEWPEPVKLKGAQMAKTDIYGVVFRPPGFSPADQALSDRGILFQYASASQGYPREPFPYSALFGTHLFCPRGTGGTGVYRCHD